MGWPVLLSLLHSELFPILKEVAYKACALRPAVCYLADLVWSLKGKNTVLLLNLFWRSTYWIEIVSYFVAF